MKNEIVAKLNGRKSEEFQVEPSDVAALELTIVPDISGRAARASLKSSRLS